MRGVEETPAKIPKIEVEERVAVAEEKTCSQPTAELAESPCRVRRRACHDNLDRRAEDASAVIASDDLLIAGASQQHDVGEAVATDVKQKMVEKHPVFVDRQQRRRGSLGTMHARSADKDDGLRDRHLMQSADHACRG